MEQIGCKECTSIECHGCNLLRLEQMLKSGKFNALMDEKHGIKTGIDVRPVVRGKWIKPTRVPDSMLDECSVCGFDTGAYTFNFCPNCGADMREESNGT